MKIKQQMNEWFPMLFDLSGGTWVMLGSSGIRFYWFCYALAVLIMGA